MANLTDTRQLDFEKSKSGKIPATRVRSRSYDVFKRLIDMLGAIIGIIVLAIPMVIIAIAIKIDSKGEVFFKQIRMGRNMIPFTCYKFRSMSKDTPPTVATADLDGLSYITRVGAVLRRFSLDEIPQLFNILIGDMAFIGPRPIIVEEEELIEKREEMGIYIIRPGLSGWAQINGRDYVTIDQKVNLDLYYVKHENLFLDAEIFIRSIICALSRKNIVEGTLDENEKEQTETQEIATTALK